MRYLGVDLAWSEHAGSGVCVLDADGTILDEDQVAPEALPGWIEHWRGASSILAIDGPLVVPPGSPALRPVERELHRRYGARHAGPYPGGAGSNAMRGRAMSPAGALVTAVGGYIVDPTDTASAHRAVEVFPAPTWLEVFGLPQRIVYKRGRLADRIAGLTQLMARMDTLATQVPALRVGEPDRIRERAQAARTAADWKAIEDMVDARLCAYVALLWNRIGQPRWVVTGSGNWPDGYVIVPTGVAPPQSL